MGTKIRVAEGGETEKKKDKKRSVKSENKKRGGEKGALTSAKDVR